jgi:GDPmannose 4,6-dehydratase
MHLMLQQDDPDDYVIATGEQHSVREFCRRAFAEAGIGLAFGGTGLDEVGVVDALDPDLLARARNGGGAQASAIPAGAEGLAPGRVLVRVDHRYFRPTEVANLIGDAAKARDRLGWRPRIGFDELVHEMVWKDLDEARKDELIRAGGFRVPQYRE